MTTRTPTSWQDKMRYRMIWWTTLERKILLRRHQTRQYDTEANGVISAPLRLVCRCSPSPNLSKLVQEAGLQFQHRLPSSFPSDHHERFHLEHHSTPP